MDQRTTILCKHVDYLMEYADKTFDLWDEGRDATVGKRLKALSGNLPGYDAGLDTIFSERVQELSNDATS